MKDELLPCPFCGAPAQLESGSDHHGEWFNLGCSRHWGSVSNPDDGCIGGRMYYTEIEKTEIEAIAAWNTRAAAVIEADRAQCLAALQAHADALVGYAEHMPHCHWGFGGETEPPRECDFGLSETLRAYEAFKAGEPT